MYKLEPIIEVVEQPDRNTWIYHFTTLNNLEKILQAEAVLSKNKCAAFQTDDVAYGHIQDRRSKVIVPNFDSSSLHDFVPFYFSPRSPMLYVVTETKGTGKRWSATDIVYLFSTAEYIASRDYSFTFTDGHPTMRFSKFFDDLRDLDKVDWSIMDHRQWTDTMQDPDKKRRRQAEFLVHSRVCWDDLSGLAVKSTITEDKVIELQNRYLSKRKKKRVVLRPLWYY